MFGVNTPEDDFPHHRSRAFLDLEGDEKMLRMAVIGVVEMRNDFCIQETLRLIEGFQRIDIVVEHLAAIGGVLKRKLGRLDRHDRGEDRIGKVTVSSERIPFEAAFPAGFYRVSDSQMPGLKMFKGGHRDGGLQVALLLVKIGQRFCAPLQGKLIGHPVLVYGQDISQMAERSLGAPHIDLNHRAGLTLHKKIFRIRFWVEDALLNNGAGLQVASLQVEVVELVETFLDLG